ncbi:hypothetical protein D3C77_588190 [compost metagenome]
MSGASSLPLFCSGVNSPCIGKVVVVINNFYTFTLEWSSYQEYPGNFGSTGVISVYNVRGSSSAFLRVRFGESNSTGYAASMYFDFNAACNVKVMYNPMNINNVIWDNLQGSGVSIGGGLSFTPAESSSYARYAW